MAHDPYRNPNDPLDPRPEPYRDLEAARAGSGWGWIIGGVVAVLLVIFFLSSGTTDRTASTTPPPATTTGQNTGTATLPPAAPRPAAPQENTGMAPRDMPAPAPAPTPAPADSTKPQ